MIKLKKRLLSLLLIMVMALSLALTGCSEDSDNSKDDNPKATQTTDNNSSKDTPDYYKIKEELAKEYKYEEMTFDEFTKALSIEGMTGDAVSLNSLLVDPKGYGITEYTKDLGEYNKAYYTREIAHSELILDSLKNYNYEELNKEQQLTYDLIESTHRHDSMMEGMEYYFSCLGPSLGIQANLPLILCEYHWYDKSYIDSYFVILEDVRDYFTQISTFEKEKSAAGLFMSDAMADATIKQCKTFIENPDTNVLITNFNEKIDKYEGLTDKERKDYKAKNEKLVKESVLPAYEDLIKTLEALKGTGVNDGGLAGFPEGKKYYEYSLKTNIGVDKSVDEITAQIDKAITANMVALNAAILFNPDLASDEEAMEIGYTDPEEILRILQKEILADFPDIGEVSYTITSFDKALEDFVSPAMYFLPPIDRETVNSIYINDKYLEESGSIFTTLAHEAFPGHLYQYVYATKEKHNPLRRQLAPNGLSEGWATYVEMMSYRYSDLNPDMANLLAINNVLSLLIQARADIGVNYEGWTLEEMSNYLADYFELDEETEKELYLQLIEVPGNTLSYICGYLEYKELENTAKTALGDKFVMAKYTEFILKTGFVPFDKMEKLILEEFVPSQNK